MRPTRRFLVIAAGGLIPALLAAANELFFAAALIYLALCLALLAASYLFGPGAGSLDASRDFSTRMSLGEWEEVAVQIQNRSGGELIVELTDTLPAGWRSRRLPASHRLQPRERAVIRYQVKPPARGGAQFGDLYAWIATPGGLYQRRLRIPAAAEARVYPDLKAIGRYEALLRRSRLSELGIRRARLAGRGSDFERIREYTPDDEFRHVDWKATARLHRPMSRVYEVERSQQIVLVVSTGRMMAGRLGEMTRLDYVVNAAAMLAHVALKGGDRVGLMTVSDRPESWVPPAKGAAHFRRLLEELYVAEARICQVDYRLAIEQVARRCKRRTLVIFFAELLDDEVGEELVRYMSLLRPTHLPLCVTLTDEQLTREAAHPVANAEDLYRRAVAIEISQERRETLERLHRAGAILLDSSPADLSARLIDRYLEIKYRQLL